MKYVSFYGHFAQPVLELWAASIDNFLYSENKVKNIF